MTKEQGRTIKLCRDVLARLGEHSNYNRFDPDRMLGKKRNWLQFPRLTQLVDRTRADLQALLAELERCHSELAAMGTSRGKGNSRVHMQFWDELTRIWFDNVGEGVEWEANDHFAKFLIACSEPFFPEDTTNKKIDDFIRHRGVSRK